LGIFDHGSPISIFDNLCQPQLAGAEWDEHFMISYIGVPLPKHGDLNFVKKEVGSNTSVFSSLNAEDFAEEIKD
jgi:hypothetical protein